MTGGVTYIGGNRYDGHPLLLQVLRHVVRGLLRAALGLDAQDGHPAGRLGQRLGRLRAGQQVVPPRRRGRPRPRSHPRTAGSPVGCRPAAPPPHHLLPPGDPASTVACLARPASRVCWGKLLEQVVMQRRSRDAGAKEVQRRLPWRRPDGAEPREGKWVQISAALESPPPQGKKAVTPTRRETR